MGGHPADVTAPPGASDGARLPRTDASDDAVSAGPGLALPAGLLGAITLLIGGDLGWDVLAGAARGHLLVEGVVFALSLGGLGWLWTRVLAARRQMRQLGHTLLEVRADASRWRHEAQALRAGVGATLERQFQAWGLSAAEREVALLLLKGLALREVAEVRGTCERTVRQQALGVYRKAGVEGRAELSAFFLEDLLPPGGAPPT